MKRLSTLLLPHVESIRSLSNLYLFVSERCDIPLGSEDSRLPDVAFTASSIYNAHYAAYQGRLNAMRSGSRFGSWIARYNNRRQWFQIDLGNKAVVIKCGIQGRYDANQWVKSYTIAYGMNGFHFRFYKEGGRTRVCLNKFILILIKWPYKRRKCCYCSYKRCSILLRRKGQLLLHPLHKPSFRSHAF